MHIDDLFDSFNERIQRTINEDFEMVRADELGLDRRAGYRLYVNTDYIVVEGGSRELDYYGGFEYVDSEHVQIYGDYKFYSARSDRVQEAIERYYTDKELEEFKDEEAAE